MCYNALATQFYMTNLKRSVFTSVKTHLHFDFLLRFVNNCVAAIGVVRFSVRRLCLRTFLFWGKNMKCENYFCIYEENGSCTLEEISLSISGTCEALIYPLINRQYLEEKKQ